MPYPNSYQEIHINDTSNWTSYQADWEDGSFSAGSTILDEYDQYQKVTKEAFNDICGDIAAQEAVINTINNFYSTQNTAFNAKVNTLTDLGVYDSTATYVPYNLVSYTISGSTKVYMALQNVPAGTAPVSGGSTYWFEVGLTGDTGFVGVNVAIKFNWSSTTAYSKFDIVYYNGTLWVALQDNTGSTPVAGSSDWEQFIDPEETQIYFSSTIPTTPFIGQIWWEPIEI